MKKLLFSLIAMGLFVAAQAQNSTGGQKKTLLSVRYTALDYRTPALVNKTSIGQVLSDKKWAQLPDTKRALGLGMIRSYSDQVDIFSNIDLSISTMPGITINAFKGYTEYFYASAESGMNVRMFKADHTVNPYVSFGLGVRSFNLSKFGAYAPLGLGLQIKTSKAATLNLTAAYATKMSKSFVPSYNYGISYNFPLN
jgi:hypothetical protein